MNIKKIFETRASKCILIFTILLFVTLFLSVSFFYHDIVQTYLWSWDPTYNSSYSDTSDSYAYPTLTPTPTDLVDRIQVQYPPDENTNYSAYTTGLNRVEGGDGVMLENLDDNNTYSYGQVSHVVNDQDHAIDVRKGSVYLLRYHNAPDYYYNGSPTLSLWRYDRYGNGARLIDYAPSEFSISQNGKEVALYSGQLEALSVFNTSMPDKDLYPLSLGESFLKVFDPVHVGLGWKFYLLGWGHGNRFLWGTFTPLLGGKSTGEIIRIDTFTRNDPVKIYTIPALLGMDIEEMDISPNSPYLVFSNYDRDATSGTVRLYAIDMETNVKKTLFETKSSSALKPIIVDNDAVSLYDSQKQSRIRVKLSP